MQIQTFSAKDLFQSEDCKFRVDGTIVALPFTDIKMARQASELMSKRASVPGLILAVEDNMGAGFVRIVNQLFKITESAYFAYVAQDAFAGRSWLGIALNALGDNKHFLGFNDGKWAGALAGFGLARRSWIVEQYDGNFFPPQYQQHYADAELTLLALQQGVYAYDPNSILVEIDWDKESKPINSVDRELFISRKLTKFDGRITDSRLLNMLS